MNSINPNATEALELLPCPFCGSAVEAVRSRVVGGADWIRHVGGANCGLEFTDFNIEDDIVAAWNRRPSTDKGGAGE